MEKRLIYLLVVLLLALSSTDGSAQIKIDLKKKINKEANRRANNKANKAVNKGFDELEKGVNAAISGEEESKEAKGENATKTGTENSATGDKPTAPTAGQDKPEDALTLNWSKYDFVPGDKIIFEDNLIGEENGEFPSRWDLVQGTVENAEFGGENVIMFRGGSPTIVPYLKNSSTDYLPDVFTVEFDLYIPGNSFTVLFYDRKNQSRPSGANSLDIWYQTMTLGSANSRIPNNGTIANRWAHIAIAFTNGKMKAYIDETRMINIPHLEFNPSGISLHCYHASDNNPAFVKNVRIAEGGVKYYDRFLQDGKIVSNGIRFDVGKASLRPESMGVLNEIYAMLKDHPEVKVSVEGHTDSDGDPDMNMKLSEDRAKTVMDQLVSMGIDKDRLSYKGFGESEPIASNDTPEGKASNRRVEFVKQ